MAAIHTRPLALPSWLLLHCLLPLAMAQNPATDTAAVNSAQSSIYGPSTSSPAPTSTGTTPASTTDSSNAAQTSSTNPNNGYPDGLVRLYFIFIALVVIIAAIATILVYRRRKRALVMAQTSRQSALAEDLSTWDPARGRRRYWQGRWRSDGTSAAEEGLNEHGEAPPPYIPKAQEEGLREDGGPAIPLHTLSREDVGLKPPDYAETTTRAVGEASSPSSPVDAREDRNTDTARPRNGH